MKKEGWQNSIFQCRYRVSPKTWRAQRAERKLPAYPPVGITAGMTKNGARSAPRTETVISPGGVVRGRFARRA